MSSTLDDVRAAFAKSREPKPEGSTPQAHVQSPRELAERREAQEAREWSELGRLAGKRWASRR